MLSEQKNLRRQPVFLGLPLFYGDFFGGSFLGGGRVGVGVCGERQAGVLGSGDWGRRTTQSLKHWCKRSKSVNMAAKR